MANKHGQGPRCPMCPKQFRTPEDLARHQQDRGHFPHIIERTPEEEFRARMQTYHQEKLAAEKRERGQ